MATGIDFLIVWVWTGELRSATSLSVVLLVLKSVVFYMWRRL